MIIMNDQQFISVLNRVSQEMRLQMPILEAPESATSEFLGEWAAFLEGCVKRGLGLSDDRWQRVAIESNTPHSRFTLDAAEDLSRDSDFRVGLQLLLGMLDRGELDPPAKM